MQNFVNYSSSVTSFVNNACLMLVLYLGFGKIVVISLYKGLENVGHTILSGRDVQFTPSMVSRTHY